MGDFKENDELSDSIPFIPLNAPYTGVLENNLPYVYSVPFKEDYVEENMTFFTKQLNEQIQQQFNLEGLKPICYTHFQGEINDFFPSGVTMALFKSEEDRNLTMYSSFDHFLLEAKISGGEIDYIGTTIWDLSAKECRDGFLEISRDRRERELGNIKDVLLVWSDKLKQDDPLGAERIFKALFNDNAFRKFASKEIWNTSLKKNPLLVLTRKCFSSYFYQPTVRDKNSSIKF